jgi:hypothetical protein
VLVLWRFGGQCDLMAVEVVAPWQRVGRQLLVDPRVPRVRSNGLDGRVLVEQMRHSRQFQRADGEVQPRALVVGSSAGIACRWGWPPFADFGDGGAASGKRE